MTAFLELEILRQSQTKSEQNKLIRNRLAQDDLRGFEFCGENENPKHLSEAWPMDHAFWWLQLCQMELITVFPIQIIPSHISWWTCSLGRGGSTKIWCCQNEQVALHNT